MRSYLIFRVQVKFLLTLAWLPPLPLCSPAELFLLLRAEAEVSVWRGSRPAELTTAAPQSAAPTSPARCPASSCPGLGTGPAGLDLPAPVSPWAAEPPGGGESARRTSSGPSPPRWTRRRAPEERRSLYSPTTSS